MNKKTLLIIASLLIFGFFNSLNAQSSGDYRTRAAGAWNSTTVWQVYNIFGGWANTTGNPSNLNGAISILHAVTISGGLSINADQVTISTGGSLTISDGTLNLYNGSGNELILTGGTLSLTNALATINAPSGTGVISATSGTVNLSNGSLASGVYAYIYNPTALNINQSGGTTFTLNGTIYNFSTNAIWNGSSTTLAIGTNGYFEIEPAGVLTITGTGTNNLGSSSSTSRLGSFAIYGTVNKTTNAVLNINTTNFYNYGSFNLTTVASTVNVNSAGFNDGIFNALVSGSIFNYDVASKTFYAGLTLSGSGTHNINASISYLVSGSSAFDFSSTINFNSPAGIPADINITSASLNCNKGVTFEGPGYALFRGNSQITVGVNGSFSTASQDTLSILPSTGGTTVGPSALTLNSTIAINGPMSTSSQSVCQLNGSGTANFAGNYLANGGRILNSNFKFIGKALQNVTGTTGIIGTTEIDNSACVEFLTNHYISSSLTFTAGRVGINDKLFIPGTASILGYTSTKYFYGYGYLKRTLAASTAYVYPIGNATHYLPATITTAATFTPDTIWMRVEDYNFNSVYNTLLSPIGNYVTAHVVEPVWRINESTAAGSNFTSLKLQWNKSNENYLFNRASCGIVRNAGISWNTPVAGAATGSDPYSRTLSTLTLGGSKAEIFGVADNLVSYSNNYVSSNSQTRSVCAGASFTFSFWNGDSSIVNVGNIFTAQLSDKNGSFAAPVAIGSITARGGRNLTVTIPPGTPVGNYYIRMISSSPLLVEQSNYYGYYEQRVSVQPFCYCGGNISLVSCASYYISSVSFGSLSRFSGCDEISGLSYSSLGIEDYNGNGGYQPNTTSVTRGVSTNLSVTTNLSSIVSVWIDYNRNGSYEASEWTQVTTSSTAAVASIVSIAVPANASVGFTGMRIRTRAAGNINGSADACTSFGSGETEEYYIYIADKLAYQSNAPTSNSRCVAATTSPSITYNSAIKSTSFSNTNFLIQGSLSGIKQAVLSGGGTSTVTLNPTQNFEAGELITVASSGLGITDTSGQRATEYCYQFTTAAAVAPKTFKKRLLTGSGASVINSYGADLNNDGYADIVDVNSSAATGYLSLYKGNGNGTFQTPTFIYTGGIPYSAAIADYDLDGDMDIAVAYGSSYKIDIYYNSGAASFTGPLSITTSHRPRTIVPFFVMDNEAPSILTANYTDSTVSVIQNFGSGVFDEISRRSLGAPVQSVVAGDFNLNGLLDVAATCNNNRIVILEFASRKSLTIRTLFSCGGTFPIDIKTADLNGDGDLDLVWSNFSTANLGYVKGSTGITFDTTNLTTISAGSFPFKIALADFDGDCDIDISSTNASTADFNLFQNSAGTFSAYNGPKGNSLAGYMVTPAAADFDEDGDIDLVGSSVAYSSKYFLENATYTLQTGTVSSPLCNNASPTISWTVSDSLPAANLFYIQLSDATGSFSTPLYLDTIAGTFSGSASVIIPAVTAGTGYRIRVISSYTGVVSTDNGVNLSIGASPTNPNINFACSGMSTILSATGGTTYMWSPSTYLSAASGSPVTATPAVTQTITLIAKDVAGCSSAARTASIGPSCYCYPNYSNNTCNNDYIASVVFNTLSYSSATCGGNDNNTTVNYFTTITPNVATDVNRLGSYTLSLTAGVSNPEGFGVWIDYNADGDYDDIGEFVYASPTTVNQTFSSSILIPAGATIGVTRMRVMIIRGSLVTALSNCSTTLSRGETQDFYIRISACAPPSTFAVSGGGAICTGSAASISLSGSASGVSYALFRNLAATGTSLTGTGGALNFSGLSTPGTYTVVASTSGGCTANMSGSASISVSSLPSTSNAGNNQTICGLTTATLSANAPTSGTGAWTIVTGSGGSFSSTTNPLATFTAAAGSTNTLRWTISSSPCTASFDDVTISFPLNPSAANAGADQLNLCGLTSTTLTATTPSVGTGAWIVVSGSGGSFSNTVLASSTFIGTAGSTYTLRWTSSNSTCTSSSDEVVIAFPRIPTTSNAGVSQTLCGLSTALLAGNTPTVGSGTWSIFSGTGGSFANAASPSSSFNGTAGNTYVLFWTISNSPCIASADSLVIAFPRNPSTSDAGPNQTLCGITTATLAANTPSSGTGAWSKVSGAGGSFANAASASSTFTGTAGVAYTLRWTINNLPCTSSSDDVIINFALNPTTANAGNDTNICNGSTINLKANTPLVGTGLWTISSGSCTITTTTSPNSTATSFTNNTVTTLIWSISNGICPNSTDSVKINSNASFCAATLADFTASSTTTCTSTSITFTDLSSNATSWNWNFGSNATPATSITQGPHTVSYSTTGNKTVSLIATGPGGSNTKTKTNYISVITIPGAPTGISGTNTVCAGTTAVSYSIAAVTNATNYVWTVPSGASIVSGAGSTAITVDYSASALSGNISVYASNACGIGSNVSLAVAVSATPTTANAGLDQLSICGLTSTTLTANAPGAGTGIWSIISGSGGSFSNANSATSSFSGTAGITYTLRWTIASAPCNASTDDVVIRFNQNPTIANAGSDQTNLCGITSAALLANSAIVGSGSWTIVSGTGGSFSNSALPTSVFVGVAGNSYTLRWTISNSPCTASTDDVAISFPLNPSTSSAGGDQTLCGGTSAILAGNAPITGTGQWSIVSGSGASFANAVSPTSSFSGLSGNSYTLRWTISNSPCTSSADEVIISFPPNPSVSNAGADQLTLCGVTSTNLSAAVPLIGAGTWSIVSGTGGSISNSNNAASIFTGIIGNSYTLSWTVASSPCLSSSDDVVILFNQNPSAAVAGNDQTLCGSTSTVLSASLPGFGNGAWSIISGSGGSFSSTSVPSATFNGTAGNAYILRWTITLAPCGSSFDEVTISFPQNPTVSNAGQDQIICSGTSTVLAANAPAIGTGSWSILTGSGGAFGNTSSAVSTFSGAAGISYTLRWTISNSPCGNSTDDVQIDFPQNPSLAFAGSDQILCGATSTSLAANIPIVGNGNWTIVSGSGGVISTSNIANSSFSGTAGSTYILRWTISNSTCTPSFDEVSVSFPQNPTLSNAGTDQSVCTVTSLSLAANPPVVGSGNWSIVSGIGGSLSSNTNPFATFTGVSGNTYNLRWTITNASCAVSNDDVLISFLQAPSEAFAGNDTTICNGASIALSANTPLFGTGQWSVVSGAAAISSLSSPTAIASSILVDSVSVLVWTISAANTCPDSYDTLKITSNTAVCIVTLADFVADTTKTCINSSVIYTDASNQATAWNWDFGIGASPAQAIGIGPHSVAYSTSGYKTITLTVSGPGGIDTTSKTNYIEIVQSPSAAGSISGSSSVCEGESNVLYSISAINDAANYNWLLPNGSSVNTFNQNSITVDFAFGATAGNISVEGTNICGTGASASLYVSINNYPTAAGIISGNDTICASATNEIFTTAVLANATSYEWILSTGLTSSSGSTTTATPQLAVNLTSGISNGNIRVYGRNSCGDGDTSVVFSFYVAPFPDAAGTISGNTSVSACVNQNGIVYSTSAITNASGYNWVLPPLATIISGANTPSITVNYDVLSVSGNISVNGTNACGSGASSQLAVNFSSVPSTDICYATVDSATVQCLLFWQRPAESYVDSFVIYSDPTGGANLTRIAAKKNTASVSTNYLDPFSSPLINAVAYQIATKDSCNNQLSLSATIVHKTINLNGILGWTGAAKLYWNEYLGISDSTRYYSVLRDTLGNGPFDDTLATGILPNSTMNYTDLTSIDYPLCRYVIVMSFSTSCDPTLRVLAGASTTRSNIKNRAAMAPDGLADYTSSDFSAQLYPNPAKDLVNVFLIGAEKTYTISIHNVIGKKVYSRQLNTLPGIKASSEIELNNIAPGIYFVQIESLGSIRKVMKLKVE